MSELFPRPYDMLGGVIQRNTDDTTFKTLAPPHEIDSCAMALLVVFDGDSIETFRYVTEFFVDDDGSLAFSYLARPKNDDLEDFITDYKEFEIPPQNEGESPFDYIARLAELPELEKRETMINACVRWELRGAFEYDKTEKVVKKVDRLARVRPRNAGGKLLSIQR